MTLKIENKPVEIVMRSRSDDWQEFILAVPKLKVGQSFLIGSNASNYRLAASIARAWLGIQLTFQREGDRFRVGRTA